MTIVYHGSKAQFNKFDHAKIGQNATSEGYGFYFTDQKSIAEAYAQNGFLYTVEFNGKKSLSNTKKTITRSQLKQFLAKLHELNEQLSNYGDIGFYGYDKVLAEAVNNEWEYNDNDVDLIASICNSYGSKEPLQVLYDMFGYDHIKMTAEWNHGLELEQTLYIALVNDIVNIVQVDTVN